MWQNNKTRNQSSEQGDGLNDYEQSWSGNHSLTLPLSFSLLDAQYPILQTFFATTEYSISLPLRSD